jgi:predicted transcriptional regulator
MILVEDTEPWSPSIFGVTGLVVICELHKNPDFEFALGGALGGAWVAGLGLKVLPKTMVFIAINLSPIGVT